MTGTWIKPARKRHTEALPAPSYHFRYEEAGAYLCGRPAKVSRRNTTDNFAPYHEKCVKCLVELFRTEENRPLC